MTPSDGSGRLRGWFRNFSSSNLDGLQQRGPGGVTRKQQVQPARQYPYLKLGERLKNKRRAVRVDNEL